MIKKRISRNYCFSNAARADNPGGDGTIAVGRQIGDTDTISILTLGAPIAAAPEAVPEPEPQLEVVAAVEPEAPAPVAVAPVLTSSSPKTGDQTIFVILGILAFAGVGVSAFKHGREKI